MTRSRTVLAFLLLPLAACVTDDDPRAEPMAVDAAVETDAGNSAADEAGQCLVCPVTGARQRVAGPQDID